MICSIVQRTLPAAEVLRTNEVIAFLDHRPVFKGHVLVAPVVHVDTLLDLPPELIQPVVTAAQKVAAAIVAGLGAQGTFVAVNNVVSQSIPHLHVHVVPRTTRRRAARLLLAPHQVRGRRDDRLRAADQRESRRLQRSA